ncbi:MULTISPECIES: restriction endonuclease subunit S [Pseudoalteromonas]|jgi:type I restriction enzyme S subunit|uniref:restriction endonuclease subunit S n=1 Tax=Pseudoalteromonas TaxID=53246 RepID=UPI0002CC0583|nr:MULTISPECIES: restriction endonuclease subunit S [Pseudoalteromonas]ENN99063.1 restriction modification system DNA specificity subunit [Pseudoalteromonas agarivorans S816]TMS70705.1 restriction endonuclease subunit S [Pseudoalteromonas sp. S1731]
MSVEINTPEIRFKGFSEEWVKQGLGSDIAEIIGGGTPSTLIPEFWDGDIDWYSPTEIGHSVYAKGSEKKITALGLKSSSAKVLPAANTILFTSRAGIGDMAILAKQGTTNQGFQSLVVKDGFSPYFIYSAGKQIKEFALKHASGSTFLEISGKQLGRMQLLVPKNKEQDKIGNIFQKLDSLINQHQQKYDKLSNIKKAMLEKMFPKQGETVPEIRFKGFSGEWEEIELSDEVTFINGRAYSQEELLDKGKYTVLRVGNFYTNSSWYYSDLELGDKYYADNGDLLYTWSASFGPHIWNGDKVIYHYHIWKLELSENIDKLFLLHLLDYDRAKILSGSNGSTMIHITKSAMEAKKVFIPKKDEQIVIGNYFQKLDALIKQHQQQITKLKNIKQACLSKMFV